MKHRPNNGLIDYELQEKLNTKMLNYQYIKHLDIWCLEI